jgi:hypothetical protein
MHHSLAHGSGNAADGTGALPDFVVSGVRAQRRPTQLGPSITAIAAREAEQITAECAAVIYVAGSLEQVSSRVQRLRAFVTSQGLQLVDICSDSDSSAHPSARLGLSSALERVRCGTATVLVIDERAYPCMPDCSWLRVAVRTAGGVFYAVSIDGAGGFRPNGSAVSDLLAAIRPRGLCQEDVG